VLGTELATSLGGIGEPSTALAVGSLVDAVFAATGKRSHPLPIKPAMLRGGTE
jgi:CO/xanthine dehydrogenase Mo-binding subunit